MVDDDDDDVLLVLVFVLVLVKWGLLGGLQQQEGR